jgi:predicted AlkP superfamily pyrophosphatase or phosphodiesterase
MQRTVVLDVVGLTPALLGPATPRLAAWAAQGRLAPVQAVTPAVTTSAQATYLTGVPPGVHGIVGNGWYTRDEGEVRFWRQSSRLVAAPKLWEVARAREPGFTCANLFWWFNMVTTADLAVTPRPMYPADGRKIPDVWTRPATLRDALQRELGRFPLFDFWGPRASIRASRWIAEAARWVEERHAPTLSLVYLPHLDYDLQRFGPDDPRIAGALGEIDAVAGGLVDHFERRGVQVVVLSEYGVTPVSRPVFINRALREAGLLAVREELGRELLDPAESRAFAVADHQVAHVYAEEPTARRRARAIVEGLTGVEVVLDETGKTRRGLDHERAGDLVAIARPDAWFAYPYWLDDRRAPDFARTVDIHRKPGYDPAELFFDPAIRLPALKIGLTLARRALGFRALLEVVPLDPGLVRGSHGRPTDDPAHGPLLVTRRKDLVDGRPLAATAVRDLLLAHVGLPPPHAPG